MKRTGNPSETIPEGLSALEVLKVSPPPGIPANWPTRKTQPNCCYLICTCWRVLQSQQGKPLLPFSTEWKRRACCYGRMKMTYLYEPTQHVVHFGIEVLAAAVLHQLRVQGSAQSSVSLAAKIRKSPVFPLRGGEGDWCSKTVVKAGGR